MNIVIKLTRLIVDRFVGRVNISKNLVRGPRDIFDTLGPLRASPPNFLLY